MIRGRVWKFKDDVDTDQIILVNRLQVQREIFGFWVFNKSPKTKSKSFRY